MAMDQCEEEAYNLMLGEARDVVLRNGSSTHPVVLHVNSEWARLQR